MRRRLRFVAIVALLTLFFAVYEFSDSFNGDFCDKNDDECNRLSSGSTVLPHHQDIDVAVVKNDEDDHEPVKVIITFTNAAGKEDFQNKFAVTIGSLMKFSSRKVVLYILGDSVSQGIANEIIGREVLDQSKIEVKSLDIEKLAKDMEAVIRPMQEQFSYKPGAYYSHALFFMSVSMHRILHNINRIIMLDADLKFTDDIVKLYKIFHNFQKENVLGIAREAQPVYRHTFWAYRQSHPGTRVGEPPPDGLTGFNSGVLLLDLDKMRQSELYNKLLTGESIKKISQEFGFKGHLGDQDFFTLIGMKHEELIYILPCQWNRQLCQWWRNNGYADVFDLYFKCEMDIKIYHGNCNTPIP